MVKIIRLQQSGGSVSAIIPKDMVLRHHLSAGDAVFAVDTPQGVLLSPVDPATQAALEAYAVVAREDREAMAALAKV